jgi:hypothetical protein
MIFQLELVNELGGEVQNSRCQLRGSVGFDGHSVSEHSIRERL